MKENKRIKPEEIEFLIQEIFDAYGYDFSNYSRSSLTRRINRLCIIEELVDYSELKNKVISNFEYFIYFLGEITVNVTEMFRDPFFFESIRKDILPIIANNSLIRVWVAGCSTGEEAFSLAMLLKEANLLHKSLIYATDINPLVLEKASKGIIPIRKIQYYAGNYLNAGGSSQFSTYFKIFNDTAIIDNSLLERIIFSSHNLISDSSINEFHLILCRNVLIYFDKMLQDRVLSLFDGSLKKGGFLCLGAKETLRFSSIEHKYQLINDFKIWSKC